MNESPKNTDLVRVLDDFMQAFRYPAQQGLLIENVAAHPVHSRADRGNAAAYFSFSDLKSLEVHISEIPPASATRTHRHTCEAVFYVLTGTGYSVIECAGQKEVRVDWKAGDVFCTPIQSWHRHVNSNTEQPARYLEITTIPLMKSLGNWSIEPGQD